MKCERLLCFMIMAELSSGTGLKFWWRQNVGSNRGGHGASSFGWDVKPYLYTRLLK